MVHDLRAMCDAIGYVVRNGIEWRALPAGFLSVGCGICVYEQWNRRWLMRYRRLARDYERRTENHEAMVYWDTVFIMTRRLARYETGQPPARRWGGNRKPASRAASPGGHLNPLSKGSKPLSASEVPPAMQGSGPAPPPAAETGSSQEGAPTARKRLKCVPAADGRKTLSP
jgi:hypothetical protein